MHLSGEQQKVKVGVNWPMLTQKFDILILDESLKLIFRPIVHFVE